MPPAGLIEVDRWLGLHGKILEPAGMRFQTIERRGKGCGGCIFLGQRATVCRAACDLAMLAGFSDCDAPPPGKRIIYIVPAQDSRQADLF